MIYLKNGKIAGRLPGLPGFLRLFAVKSAFGADVYLPAGQLGRQAGVLSLVAYGQES